MNQLIIFQEKAMAKTGKQWIGLIVAAVALILFGSMAGLRAFAQKPPAGVHAAAPGGRKSSLKNRRQWHVKPFRVIGNIYAVGLNEYESWLITTPQGHFLIDEFVPEDLRSNIEELGFKVKDIKYLLVSHAHNDHVLGLAQMKEWSGAKVLAMPGDTPVLADGGASDNYLPNMLGPVYPPVKVDHVLHDGEKVQLGGVTMVAHLTAGHTKGCTTWTTEAEEKGKKYNVVIFGSCTSMNQPLVGNKGYPNVAEDFENQFKTLRSLHGDVLLGERGRNWEEKVASLEKNPGTNPFIDPKGYEEFVAKNEKAFHDELQKEKAGGTGFPLVIADSPPCPKDGRACYNVYDLIMKCCAKLGATPSE
jgi:metallo-beta-lactamase class B